MLSYEHLTCLFKTHVQHNLSSHLTSREASHSIQFGLAEDSKDNATKLYQTEGLAGFVCIAVKSIL